MSAIDAPSRNTCLTFEFMKTVQRVPRSHGNSAVQASAANSDTLYPRLLAKVSMKDPHPDEQASLISMRVSTPRSTKMALMS